MVLVVYRNCIPPTLRCPHLRVYPPPVARRPPPKDPLLMGYPHLQVGSRGPGEGTEPGGRAIGVYG